MSRSVTWRVTHASCIANSGVWRTIGSSHATSPSLTSAATTVEAIGFDMEANWKTVSRSNASCISQMHGDVKGANHLSLGKERRVPRCMTSMHRERRRRARGYFVMQSTMQYRTFAEECRRLAQDAETERHRRILEEMAE